MTGFILGKENIGFPLPVPELVFAAGRVPFGSGFPDLPPILFE
jgi:hypothetical protein